MQEADDDSPMDDWVCCDFCEQWHTIQGLPSTIKQDVWICAMHPEQQCHSGCQGKPMLVRHVRDAVKAAFASRAPACQLPGYQSMAAAYHIVAADDTGHASQPSLNLLAPEAALGPIVAAIRQNEPLSSNDSGSGLTQQRLLASAVSLTARLQEQGGGKAQAAGPRHQVEAGVKRPATTSATIQPGPQKRASVLCATSNSMRAPLMPRDPDDARTTSTDGRQVWYQAECQKCWTVCWFASPITTGQHFECNMANMRCRMVEGQLPVLASCHKCGRKEALKPGPHLHSLVWECNMSHQACQAIPSLDAQRLAAGRQANRVKAAAVRERQRAQNKASMQRARKGAAAEVCEDDRAQARARMQRRRNDAAAAALTAAPVTPTLHTPHMHQQEQEPEDSDAATALGDCMGRLYDLLDISSTRLQTLQHTHWPYQSMPEVVWQPPVLRAAQIVEETEQAFRDQSLAAAPPTAQQAPDIAAAAAAAVPWCPVVAPWTDADDLRTAAAMQTSMEQHAETSVCAVCACYTAPINLHSSSMPLLQLPNLQLLLADGPQAQKRTAELPRDALTRVHFQGISYCLCPGGVTCQQLQQRAPPAPEQRYQDTSQLYALSEPLLAVCQGCQKSLHQGNVPPASLLRVDAGCLPRALKPEDVLLPLTWVERKLLSVGRAHRHMVFLMPAQGKPRPTACQHAAMQGHVVAVPNPDVGALAAALIPCALEDVGKLLQVVFLTPVRDRKEAAALARSSQILQVRGKVVAVWAEYLARYWSTHGITTKPAVLEQYRKFDTRVPDEVWQEAVYSSTEAGVVVLQQEYRQRCSGYAPGRQPLLPADGDDSAAAVPVQSGEDAMEGDGSGVLAVEMEVPTVPVGDWHGLVAEAARGGPAAHTAAVAQAGRAHNSGGEGRVLVSAAGGQPGLLSDYDHLFVPRLHPWVFPHGTGGRPKGMSMEKYAAIILRRWPRSQFAEDNTLALDLNDVVQRQNVNLGVRIQAKWQGSRFQDIAALRPADVDSALQFLQQGLRGSQRQQAHAQLSMESRQLADAYKCVGAKIRGTPASFSRLRSEMFALWHMFGPFTVSINLNPSDTHCWLALKLAGHEYKFDATGQPETGPGGRPDIHAIWRAMAGNPTACAQFFHAFLAAFCATFLGWPLGEARQRPGRWLFGRVKAYAFKYETGGRGTLHTHGPIIQPQLQAAQLHQYLATPSGQQYIVAALDRMICQAFPLAPPSRQVPAVDGIMEVTARLATLSDKEVTAEVAKELLDLLQPSMQPLLGDGAPLPLKMWGGEDAVGHPAEVLEVLHGTASRNVSPPTSSTLSHVQELRQLYCDYQQLQARYQQPMTSAATLQIGAQLTALQQQLAARVGRAMQDLQLPWQRDGGSAALAQAMAQLTANPPPAPAVLNAPLASTKTVRGQVVLDLTHAFDDRGPTHVDSTTERPTDGPVNPSSTPPAGLGKDFATLPRRIATVRLNLETASPVQLARHVQAALLGLQIHAHTLTCRKNNHQGTHTSCRMESPLLEVGSSCVDPTTRAVLLRRDHGLLIGCLKALMLAVPCNHAIMAFCDQSRYMRQLVLWLRAKKQGSKDAVRPLLRSLEQNAADAAMYAAKYASKVEGVAQNAGVLLATDRMIAAAENSEGRPPLQQARLLVSKALNAVHGSITVAATLASMWTLYQQDSIISHATVPHNYAAFAAHLHPVPNQQVEMLCQLVCGEHAEAQPDPQHEPMDVERCADADLIRLVGAEDYAANTGGCIDAVLQQPATPAACASGQQKQRVVHVVLDYTHRCALLSDWSPWLVAMWCTKVKLQGHQGQWAFQEPHPQASTHGLVPHPRAAVKLPRAICTVPVRPAATAPASERDAYAAFVLGNFASDRAAAGAVAYGAPVGQEAAEGAVWGRMQRWLADPQHQLYSVPAAIVLENIDSHRRTQIRSATKRKEVGPSAEEVLAQAPLPAVDTDSDDSDMMADDDDIAEGLFPVQLPEVGAEEPTDTCVGEQYSLEAACEAVDKAGLSYEAAAFQAIPDCPKPRGTAVPPGSLVQPNTDKEADAQINQLREAIKAKYKKDSCPEAVGMPSLPADQPAVQGYVELLQQAQASAQPPAFVREACPGVTAEQVADLFNLDAGQRASLYTLTATLQAELAHMRDPSNPAPKQLRAVQLAGPGMGKTRVIHAFEWYCAQQHQQGVHIKTSVSWRGCEALRTPLSAARSTCWYFKIDWHDNPPSQPGQFEHVQQHCSRPVIFVILDELSFVSPAHLYAISTSLRQAFQHLKDPRVHQDFGGMHFMLSGDLLQHPPVKAPPLYQAAPPKTARSVRQAAHTQGHKLWETFTAVHWLSVQHRQDSSPGGQQLQRYISLFNGEPHGRSAQEQRRLVAEMCEALQQRVLPSITPLLERGVRLVVTRNALRHSMALRLCRQQANRLGQRLTVWRAVDDIASHSLTPALDEQLCGLPASSAQKLNGVTMFYPGCPCTFVESPDPELGQANNCFARMHHLVLDPRERDDDPSKPYRMLKYLPKALVVQLDSGPDTSMLIPLTPHTRQFAWAAKLEDGSTKQFKVSRATIPVGDGDVVTDYFIQGASFGSECWAVHLTPPPRGRVTRSSLYVILSRHRSFDDIQLVAPLWNNDSEKEAVINKFLAATQVDPELQEDIVRLKRLAAEHAARTSEDHAKAAKVPSYWPQQQPDPDAMQPDPDAEPDAMPV